ncbi:hypothetical protein INR49_016375 [Caranx melampygus]|nr:hypothetical protein INR49_016375 [Caranx melampygus]
MESLKYHFLVHPLSPSVSLFVGVVTSRHKPPGCCSALTGDLRPWSRGGFSPVTGHRSLSADGDRAVELRAGLRAGLRSFLVQEPQAAGPDMSALRPGSTQRSR